MAACVPVTAQVVALAPPLHMRMLLITPGVADSLALSSLRGTVVQIVITEADSRKAWTVLYHNLERVFYGGWAKLVRSNICTISRVDALKKIDLLADYIGVNKLVLNCTATSTISSI